MSTPELLVEASRLRAELASTGYGLAYGSQATSEASSSDLDLLFVGPRIPAYHRDALTRQVLDLHRRHGLRIDAEVAHEVKLYATLGEVRAALNLAGFTADGRLNVMPIPADATYLNSATFKARLILNALSSPHVFLGGRLGIYQSHCAQAEQAIVRLAMSLLPAERTPATADLLRALLIGTDGAMGKDYLGYAHTSHLYSVLQRGLARMNQSATAAPRRSRSRPLLTQ